jgi:hypothetical protein
MAQSVNDLTNLAGLLKDQYGSVPQKSGKKKRKFKCLDNKLNK